MKIIKPTLRPRLPKIGELKVGEVYTNFDDYQHEYYIITDSTRAHEVGVINLESGKFMYVNRNDTCYHVTTARMTT